MAHCTLALGYLTAPVVIESSVINPSSDYSTASLETLSIAYFVLRPPTTYPTIAKHVLKLASSASHAEREWVKFLLRSLSAQRYGIIKMHNDRTGILSHAATGDKLILQIVHVTPEQTESTATISSSYPMLALDQLMPLPLEILQLCQQQHDPAAVARLRAVADQIYRIGLIYGYWDLYRVMEGICQRFNIDPRQLITQQQ